MICKRNINLDLIRCFAVCSVISVHFFLNSGFYGWIFVDKLPFFACCLRAVFMTCVPMFLLLTGFLMNKKTISKKYYKSIIKTILTYIIATLFILLYRCVFLNEIFSIEDIVYSVVTYGHYSWYIGMYIGLFLIIPFLNSAYHGLKTKKQKRILVFTCLFLTTLASTINSAVQFPIFPTWWAGLYPPLYYFMGAYICEYKDEIKLSMKCNAILIICATLYYGYRSYKMSYGGVWNSDEPGSYGDIKIVVCSLLLFCFFLRINADRMPLVFKKLVSLIAELSLGVYLLSWIFDNLIYKHFNIMIDNTYQRFYYFPIIVVLVILGSLSLSYIVETMCRLILSFFHEFKELIMDPTQNEEGNGIDLLKFIAAILVCMSHTGIVTSFNPTIDMYVINTVFRWTIPFFFCASGFLMNSGKKFLHHCKRLIVMYLLWSLIYIVLFGININLSNCYSYLLNGVIDIFWFFPSMLICIILVKVLSLFLKPIYISAVAFILYLFGMLGDSYSNLFPEASKIIIELQSILGYINTRNGILFGTLFVAIGCCLKEKITKDTFCFSKFKNRAYITVCILFVLLFIEIYLIYTFNLGTDKNFLFSTLLLAPLLLVCFSEIQIRSNLAYHLRKLSVLIYVVHPFFLFEFTINNSLIKFLMVLFCSLVVSIIIINLSKKYKLLSNLY